MRVYISGPITGAEYYAAKFACAEQQLKQEGYKVVNPVRVNQSMPDDMTNEDYLKLDLKLVDMCDVIYMMDGWEKSCGANREYGYALAKDKLIVFQSEP